MDLFSNNSKYYYSGCDNTKLCRNEIIQDLLLYNGLGILFQAQFRFVNSTMPFNSLIMYIMPKSHCKPTPT